MEPSNLLNNDRMISSFSGQITSELFDALRIEDSATQDQIQAALSATTTRAKSLQVIKATKDKSKVKIEIVSGQRITIHGLTNLELEECNDLAVKELPASLKDESKALLKSAFESYLMRTFSPDYLVKLENREGTSRRQVPASPIPKDKGRTTSAPVSNKSSGAIKLIIQKSVNGTGTGDEEVFTEIPGGSRLDILEVKSK